ncbi:MAG: type IX secretion system sortase PorU [bacterium]
MKRFLWLVVLVFLLTSKNVWSKNKYNDYEITYQNNNSLIIEYRPEHISFDTVIVNQREYLKPDFHLASPANETGEPMLQVRNFILGIPLQGKVNVTVISSDYKTVTGARILPVPKLEKDGDFTREVYREGDAFQQARMIPETAAELANPGYIRNQRVITLKISPIQYNPAENLVVIYQKIRVRIQFSEMGSMQTQSRQRSDFETIIDRGLINSKQAKKWRVQRPLTTAKRENVRQIGFSYKIPIYEPGVYKITGSFLSENGVDISSIDPETIKMYNNGGKQLPRDIDAERPDGLVENPILVYGTEDESFDESDYLIFYGKGVSGWEFNNSSQQYEHYLHIYDNKNIYFLVFNDGIKGERIQTEDNSGISGAEFVSSARRRIFFEKDENNLISGGVDWYGHEFSEIESQKSYQLMLDQPVLNGTINFRFKFKGGSSHYHRFIMELNENQISTFNLSNKYERITSASYSSAYQNGPHDLIIRYLNTQIGSKAYLDWYEVEYPCQLNASKGSLSFFSPSEPDIYKYNLTGFDETPLALDITKVTEVRQMKLESNVNGWTFIDTVQGGKSSRFYVVEKSGYKIPTKILEDEISQLRSTFNQADLLIITHNDFYDQAVRFKSHKEAYDSISVFLCDIQDVYDEFSSGVSDPVAIRDFVKYCYDFWAKRPTMLLLFGDGDYDYRNILSSNDNNWIPPFEYKGDNHNAARATDDWYTYVSGNDTYMDLSVGRFPVQTIREAEAVVDKIILYESNPVFDWWRNLFTLIGDDEYGGTGSNKEVTHINATERIANNVIPSRYELKKIYLTEYPEVLSRKPDAKADVIKQINKGTVWVNFIGHGNREDLAHERVFEKNKDMSKLENKEKHCFFYAATCHFGRYDKPDDQSGAEQLLTSTEGIGAIGTIAASRECSPTPNEALNELLLQELLTTESSIRIGEAFVIAKNKNNYLNNDEKYILFADPSMQLGVPKANSVITEIEPDTLKALDKVTVKGKIEKQGAVWTGFDGTVYLQCFDSKKDIKYITEDVSFSYSLSGNAIFRGKKEINGATYEFSFIIPKDLSYGGTTARVSTYFHSKNRDGNGSRELLPVGGSSDLDDVQGPEINLYFTGYENFISGDMVEEDPELVASLIDDKSGINITEEIGHKIMLYVDDQDPINVTQNFQYNKDSYLAGKVNYTLHGLSDGEHTILLKAWDNANNSSKKTISFEIVPEDELRIEEVLNYPNPMQESTHFTFKLNKDADIVIKIYTVSGRVVCRLSSLSGFSGFNMIPWDGRDEIGDPVANGVYLYKITAKTYETDTSLKKEKIGKLIIMR